MTLFFLKFFITNIVFSFILCSVFIRLDKIDRYSRSELLLYSLGLGPAFTTLLLYYSFLFIPHQSNLFYLVLIGSVFFLIAIVGRTSIRPLYDDLVHNMKDLTDIFRQPLKAKVENVVLMVIICVPLALYIFVYLTKILPQPLVGHDVLNYGIMGRILFEGKSLAPIWVTDYAKSGYIYSALHAPSFSLLLTWEELINSTLHVKSDLYFKSISVYYALLIVAVQFYWVSKQNKWLAMVAVFALLSGVAFFIKLFSPHIDTYRIFFFIMSLIYLAYAVKEPDYLSVILFSVFSGFAAFSHRIGVITSAIIFVIFIVMMNGNFKTRAIRIIIVVMLVLVFGGDHYMFDLIWGRGNWLQLK